MITPPVYERSSGVLLHVTSLPGPYGIGDLGPAAMRWVDWLSSTGTRYWQVLPLGPTGYGDSPYSSFSSHAGNPDLISPEALVVDGLLRDGDLVPYGGETRVDYRLVGRQKRRWIETALGRLEGHLAEEFVSFRHRQAHWLDPFSMYMAIKEEHGGGSWTGWPERLRSRDPAALDEAATRLAHEIDVHAFGQFLFYRQLAALREHALESGVEIIGDVPLYVAPDSVDVWLSPELFTVGEDGEPTHVAGVPPDMFSDTGQRWGNPLYRWDRHAADGFGWWAERMSAFFDQADVLRIDHFTGLVTFYEIDGANPTAMDGVWREGPGLVFFEKLEERLGPLRVIVEDLGPVGHVVEDLRRRLGYPGMGILQEAFDSGRRPGPVETDLVIYTGTHDNDTARGRFESETAEYRAAALDYTGDTDVSYPAGLVQRAWESDAVIAVAPMQDLLGLGTEARMNYPGTTDGNWQWRVTVDAASPALVRRLLDLNQRSKRST